MKTHGLFRATGEYLQINHNFKQYIVNEKFCILYNISKIYNMSSEANATDVFLARPLKPTTGNGLYTVEDTSGPYSTALTINDAVGTAKYPYLRSCEAAYTGTLYHNVGKINNTITSHAATITSHAATITDHTTTLTNVVGNDALAAGHTITGLIGTTPIAGSITNNVSTITGVVSGHTTSISDIIDSIGIIQITGGTITQAIATLQLNSGVSSGCITQVLGVTPIGGVVINSDYNVDVGSNTTIISSINKEATSVRASYTYINTSQDQIDAAIAIYDMGAYDIKEFGCSKTVMFTATNWVNETDSTGMERIDLGQLAFLYAGSNNYFMQNGQKSQFYQFLYIGDFVTFQMLTDGGGGWLFVVTNYNSSFTNTINVDKPTDKGFVNFSLITQSSQRNP
jgi:hypothetical protein